MYASSKCRWPTSRGVVRRGSAPPFGAPGDIPPCIRHRPFGIAGAWHDLRLRVRAPHRGLRCMGNLLDGYADVGRGYEGGYDAVRRCARQWSKERGQATAAAYVPLSFAPGFSTLSD